MILLIEHVIILLIERVMILLIERVMILLIELTVSVFRIYSPLQCYVIHHILCACQDHQDWI